ncbi:MAG: hypothetical protein QW096_11555 [Thermofilaceae archaeon]
MVEISLQVFRGLLTEDARRISDLDVENFSMDKYLEVINKSCAGKSLGMLHGLLLSLLEK